MLPVTPPTCVEPATAPTLEELEVVLTRLGTHDGTGRSETELVDHLAVMEKLKNALAAAQARVILALAEARAAREAEEGVPTDRRCRGLAAEIALARRESPVRGSQHLGLATVLVRELPNTMAALTRGEISEWRATLVARETATLSKDDRLAVDRELADELTTAGDRKTAALARKIAYRLDPGSAIRRVRGAVADRRVSVRPAPDTMTWLSALLPVAQGVACKVALEGEAARLRATGDTRTRGQIMADTLVERVTGRATEHADVRINLVMTDHTIVAGDHTPAHVDGYGPIPAALARRLVRKADKVFIRRLFTSPTTGQLVGMDARSRLFEGGLRDLLVLRDQFCRNPWCDAPIRHADHVERVVDGGETALDNGQGLCEACNYAKEAPGWRTRRGPDTRHAVETTTPTGHRYQSRAPDPPGAPMRPGYPVRVDFTYRAA